MRIGSSASSVHYQVASNPVGLSLQIQQKVKDICYWIFQELKQIVQSSRETSLCGRIRGWSTSKKVALAVAVLPIVCLTAIKVMKTTPYTKDLYERYEYDIKYLYEVYSYYRKWGNPTFNESYDGFNEASCRFGETVDGKVRDFKFFKSSAESGDFTGQYCLGKIFEKGIGEQVKSIPEARSWYKKAYEGGLRPAKIAACQPSMFPEVNAALKEEFEPVCCPPVFPRAYCISKVCPWSSAYLDSDFFRGGC